MSLLHVLSRSIVPAILLAVLIGVGVLGFAELVERGADTPAGDLIPLILWRLVPILREVGVVLCAIGAAAGVGWLRRSGQLQALGAAGVDGGRTLATVMALTGTLGLAMGGLVELGVPTARDRALEVEARLGGLQLEAGWVRTDEGMLALRPDGSTLQVELVDGGLGRRTVRTGDAVETLDVRGLSASTAHLPPPDPALVELWSRSRSLPELGLGELTLLDDPLSVRWRRHRALGPVGAGLLVALAAVLALVVPVGPGPAALVAGLGALGLQLAGLVSASSPGSGWPALALLIALTLLRRRSPRY